MAMASQRGSIALVFVRSLLGCSVRACVHGQATATELGREVSVSEKHHIYLGTWELLVAMLSCRDQRDHEKRMERIFYHNNILMFNEIIRIA
jgi:hypothetical protein